MTKSEEKQKGSGKTPETRAPPIKPVRAISPPGIKNIPEKPVIRLFLKKMRSKVETAIFEKDGEEKREI